MFKLLVHFGFHGWCLFTTVLFMFIIINTTVGITVKINFSRDDVKDLPETLGVTFPFKENTTKTLHLQRVSNLNFDIPIYTVEEDDNGAIKKRRQIIDTDKSLGFYQDVINQANIKITRESDGQQTIKGEFIQDGKTYSISPSHKVKRETGPHQQMYSIELKHEPIHRSGTHDDFIKLTDTKLSTNAEQKLPLLRHKIRHTRDVKPAYYIDVAAAVDNSVYQLFVNKSVNNASVYLDILEYFSFVFNGIDLCYRGITWTDYNLNVRLVKIVVFQDIYVYNVTFREDAPTFIDADTSLNNFTSFLATSTGFNMFVPFDHVMLFVGSEMKSSSNTDLLGMAWGERLCEDGGDSVSIISEFLTYSTILTAAHELAHSISALHDGQENDCSSDDRYIMASYDTRETPGTELNPWIFSNCSVDSFTKFISRLLPTSRGRLCLNGMIPIDPAVLDTSDRYLGQIYPPDKQCELKRGRDYYYCRSQTGQGMCTQLQCCNKVTQGRVYVQQAYHGTTCGSGKLCKQGSCVSDQAAPVVNEKCMFGDFSKDCLQIIKSFPGSCYIPLAFRVCCSSCLSFFAPVEGCEYGDRVRGCSSSVCNSSNMTAIQECCGTCSYGTTYTTAATTTAQAVTTTKRTTASTAAPSCHDDPQFRMNGLSCSALIWNFTDACYNQTVLASCCATCSTANTGVLGCEFGDKVKDKCFTNAECKLYKPDCCESCRGVSCQDDPAYRVDNMSCSALVKSSNNVCYDRAVRFSCCASCFMVNTGIYDCPFGDRVKGKCQILNDCETYSFDCCQSCREMTTAPSCLDDPEFQVNEQICSTVVRHSENICYNSTVQASCCASCTTANTGVLGCEFGDRVKGKCTTAEDCELYSSDCCDSCKGLSGAASLDLSRPLFALLIVYLHMR